MHCSLFCLFLNKDFKVTEMPSFLLHHCYCVVSVRLPFFLQLHRLLIYKTTPCVVSVPGSPPTPPNPADGLSQHLVVPIPPPNVRRAMWNHRRREVGDTRARLQRDPRAPHPLARQARGAPPSPQGGPARLRVRPV
jgi:hypothetical protein